MILAQMNKSPNVPDPTTLYITWGTYYPRALTTFVQGEGFQTYFCQEAPFRYS